QLRGSSDGADPDPPWPRNGLCSDGAPDCIPPRASRGRRSGVIVPGGGQDTDTILLESVKAAPRRSSIIKLPKVGCHCRVLGQDT
uniref:Uncharacterized protein n=1 Tax=Periophthalmus magnuspinnatus TaxID=409849 RepID=A0A3B3ZZC4_9GOBI